MAKSKGRRSSGADTAISNGGVAVNDSSNVTDALPSLDESVLANLTQKIEQKLQGNNGTPKNSQKKSKGSANNTPKKDNEASQKAGGKQDSKKGKKRDRNGDVIAREEKNAGKTKQSKSQGDDKKDALRQEILALGGSNEDYDLIAGVDSDAEEENQANAPAKSKSKADEDKLRKELAKMLEDAGQVVSEDADEEDEGDDAEDEDVEISDVEEDVTPPPPPKATKEAPKQKEAQKSKEEPKKEPDAKASAAGNEREALPKAFSKLVGTYSATHGSNRFINCIVQTIPPRPDWYSTPLPPISASKHDNVLPRHLVDRVRQYARSLLEKENEAYTQAQQTSSSYKFYSTIMSTGTLSDKISAFTLAVQESPVHNMKALENLIGLARKRSRAQAVEVLRSLKDMFAQGTLLPGDRRLKTFANQPSLAAAFQSAGGRWTERDPLPGGLQPSHLIIWAFEDYLKEQYFEVLKILEVWCNDEIEFSRSRAVSYVYELLKEKPEQEANLLRLLVNKLGDPGRKIASRASYLLLQLEQAHPLMKATIIKSIESELLFRPGQSQHAKYYAVITLNQTILSRKEEQVAVQLLDIYFSLFVTLLKPTKDDKFQKNQKGGKFAKGGKNAKGKKELAKGQNPDEELREKLISAVLTGVNRAYPFTNADSERYVFYISPLSWNYSFD